MARPLEDVYCTLLMSDSYLPGARVLANSLRDAGTTKKLAVLITLETLSADTITELKTLYDYLIPVDRIRTVNLANLYLMGRPDLSFAFTKIALWRQTQFRKIVYLDADVVALRALDELFDIKASFAAAPDIGWPDAFNSGVMVLTPDMGEYWALQTMAATGDSFDGADQGLLNQYFEHRPWQRLKFTYNCTPNAEYQWEPAYRYYKRDIAAVHFIGKEKPWSGRHAGGSGVYGGLLARWWAVHNRHLHRAKTPADLSSGTLEASAPDSDAAPEAPITTTELPMTEVEGDVQDIDQGLVEPPPTASLRDFSAPEMEWDATKFEPPAQSKPEAANFPSQTYTFSESKALFRAPQAYPEPPRDMWYKIPETKPKPAETPTPIFPWEREPDRPRATRIFVDDIPAEPTPAKSSPTHPFSTVHYETDDRDPSPEGVSPPKTADEHWQAFQQSNANAWDSVPGIEHYVRGMVESQGRRGKPASFQQTTGTEDISSPLLERRNRRESLIITDFPTAVERPSLPVTPAPLRRPMFWGEERNQAGELPSATGVPDQTEWNPTEKLDQLRRSSLVEFEHLTKDEHPNPPLRSLPEHSVLTKEAQTGRHASYGSEKITSTGSVSESQVPGAFPVTPGIVQKDFASNPAQEARDSERGRFFSSGGLTTGEHTESQHFSSRDFASGSSSTFDQNFSSSTEHSSSQREFSSTSQTVQAGKTTFSLPEFGGSKGPEPKTTSTVDDNPSPVRSRQ
ncbi:glycogenin glucosyltransferase [Coniothyrium glycines]